MKFIVALILLSVIVGFGANLIRAPEVKAVPLKETFEPSVLFLPLHAPNLDQRIIYQIPDLRAVAGSPGKNIVFAEDGQNVAVLYCRYSGDQDNMMQVYVAYSTDRGNTWMHYGPLSTFNARRTFPGLDAEANWSDTNDLRIHFSWHQAPRYSGNFDTSAAFYARDVMYPNGSIATAFRLPNSGAWDVWLPCIAVKDSFVIIIAINNGTSQTTNDSYIWRSTDYGETWDNGMVFFPGPLEWMAGPHFRFGNNGYMFFLWNRRIPSTARYWPYYCESFDYGLTWTQPQPIWQNTPPYLDMSMVTSWWYQYDCDVVRDTPVATIKLGTGTNDYGEIWVYRPDSGGLGNWHFKGKKLVGGDSIAPQPFARFPTVATDDSGNIFIGYQAIFDTVTDCGLFARPAIKDIWYNWGRFTFNGDIIEEKSLEFAHNAPLIATGDSVVIGMIYHNAGTYPDTGNLYFDYVVLPNPPIKDVTVWLPDTTAEPNDTVIIPIMASDVIGRDVISCDITLTFNSDILSALPASLGNIIPQGWQIQSNVFPESIKISLYGTNPITDSGSLVLIPFVVNDSAIHNNLTIIHFSRCSFNNGSVKTMTRDGTFTVFGPIPTIIEFTYVPPYRSHENLRGRVRNGNPNSCSVAVYIFVDGAAWWTKPYFASPLTPVDTVDSTWTCDITTGGSDEFAIRIRAYIWPNGIGRPPRAEHSETLPSLLDTFPYADTIRTRPTIHFSGYDWEVKAGWGIGPHNNYFSDDSENVWVDEEDKLHLKISYRSGIWYCSEVACNESLGYGPYYFYVSSPVGQLNENVVLGLFTWDNWSATPHREIDIEFSRWGDTSNPYNAQYVIQPYESSGNIHRWWMPPDIDSSTHIFNWQQDSIRFLSFKGYYPNDSILQSWFYTGSYIPLPGDEQPRINLWLYESRPPSDSNEVEVIISSFAFGEFRIISGNIRYYYNQKPVESTKVVLSGTIVDTTLTDSTGFYQFTDLLMLQNYTVSPSKINSVRQAAVSSYDAALILQHVVGRITLDSLQRIAADVSDNGTISSFDAAQVLQYVVGIRNHFPVGHRPGQDTVDWAFRPPSRTYDTLRENQINQDYRAILYGDPSGNWQPSEFLASLDEMTDVANYNFYSLNMPDCEDKITTNEHEFSRIKEERNDNAERNLKVAATTVTKPSLPGNEMTGAIPRSPCEERSDEAISKNNEIKEIATLPLVARNDKKEELIAFPIKITGAKDMISADMLISYDAKQLTLKGLRTTKATEGFMIAATDMNGLVRIGIAGTKNLNGDVTLLEILFEKKNNTEQSESDGSELTGTDTRHLKDLMTKSKSRQSLIKVPVENLDLENSQEQSPSVLWLVLNEGTPTELTKEAEGSMGKESKLPTNFYLAQPKPNPFGTGTSIGYGLPQASDVKLSVFDASGSLVRTLVEISQTAGLYSVIWNGKDNTNRQLANGIYFIRMQAGTNKFLRKAILLKQ